MAANDFDSAGIFMTTSGAVTVKAGVGVNSTIIASGVAMARAIEQAQSYVNAATKINLNDQYSGLDDDTKMIIDDAVSSQAATSLIGYDMTGYLNLQEASTLINFNWATRDAAIQLLKDRNVTADFIGATP